MLAVCGGGGSLPRETCRRRFGEPRRSLEGTLLFLQEEKQVAFGKCRMEETLSSRTFPFPSLSCKQQMGHLDGMNMRPACSHCKTTASMSCLKRRQLADLGWKSIYEAHYFTSPLFRLATYRGCCIHKIQLRQFTRVGVRVDQN